MFDYEMDYLDGTMFVAIVDWHKIKIVFIIEGDFAGEYEKNFIRTADGKPDSFMFGSTLYRFDDMEVYK